jgi:hypothetical protein
VLAPQSAVPRAMHPAGVTGSRPPERASGSRSEAWPFVWASILYLAMSLAIWWRLLAHGFGAVIPAGSADPAQEVWFLAWLPHALGAGLNPFFSHAVFAPSGVNLLDNTSTDLLGLVLAPVTVTAGPVASLDVAVLLAPALSALGAFTLCRRYVTWSPASFVGGLCYGFGPFVTGDLRYGHLDLTWLVLPPLIFCCLDALLVRGTRRPLRAGAVLGVLVVCQFFVSTELLAITAIMTVVLAIVMSVGWPRAVLPRLAAAWRGLSLATLIIVAVLAYPFWVVVAGPRHVVGPVWRHIGTIATSLTATAETHAELAGVAFVSGSNGSYLGIALLAVLAVGAVVLWRAAVLRVVVVAAFVAYLASLGYELHVGHRALDIALPAAVLAHVRLLDSIVPERFAAMVDLFCGLALAVVVDHVRRWDRPRSPRAMPTSGCPVSDRGTAAEAAVGRSATPMLVALSLAVAAFALVPFVAVPHWPYEVTPIDRPAALARPRLGGAGGGGGVPVVAIYPDASKWVADEMVWQAQDDFSFSLPDGYAIVPGRGLHAVESPPLDALWLVFAAGSVGRLRVPLTRTTRGAVLGDLRALGVDDVVVVPGAEGSPSVERALREVLGRPAREQGGAARWRTQGAAG